MENSFCPSTTLVRRGPSCELSAKTEEKSLFRAPNLVGIRAEPTTTSTTQGDVSQGNAVTASSHGFRWGNDTTAAAFRSSVPQRGAKRCEKNQPCNKRAAFSPSFKAFWAAHLKFEGITSVMVPRVIHYPSLLRTNGRCKMCPLDQ